MKPVPQGPLDGNAPQTARTRRIVAVVISNDDGLIIDLGPYLGDRYRTRPVDNADELAANPVDGEWLAILDAVHRPDAMAEAARLEMQSAAAPIIAIIPSGDEAHWSASLARGSVLAVVPRDQIGGPALQQALEAAEARLRSQAAPTITLPHVPEASGSRRPLALFAGALLALLAAAAAWHFLRGRAPTPTTIAGPGAKVNGTAPVAARPALSALELLSAARVAFASQRQLPRIDAEFKGDSALELYVQVLATDPKNEEARDGVRRLLNVARARIQADINAARFDEAAKLLDLFRTAGVEADATAGFEAEIGTARLRWLVNQAQGIIAGGDIAAAEQALAELTTTGVDPATLQDLRKALEARRQDLELQEMANAVHTAIAAGNLFEPLADNARTRLQAMRQINRTHATTVATQHDYAEALFARAQEARRAQQFDAAQRYLAAAADVAAADELATARRELQTDIDAASQRAAAAAALSAASNVATATAPATIKAHPTRPLSAELPPQALAAKLKGYVIVEFTLTADGRATDIVAVESEPKGVFDKSATDSVARGRFDTSNLGPERKPQRARIRLSFK
jgi:TonB family protein